MKTLNILTIMIATLLVLSECKKTPTTPPSSTSKGSGNNSTSSTQNSMEQSMTKKWLYKRMVWNLVANPNDTVVQNTTDYNNPATYYMDLRCTPDTTVGACINTGYLQVGGIPFGPSMHTWVTIGDTLFFMSMSCAPNNHCQPYIIQYLTADSLILRTLVSAGYFTRYHFHKQ